MTELKTLKDMQTHFKQVSAPQNKYELIKAEYIFLSDLRSEAIKWVKELEKYEVPVKISKFVTIIRKNHAHGDVEGYHIRAWLAHFFNLTEEDLK